jgi:hypothetical protein
VNIEERYWVEDRKATVAGFGWEALPLLVAGGQAEAIVLAAASIGSCPRTRATGAPLLRG